MYRFTISDLMIVTSLLAAVLSLCRLLPDFWTTWAVLGLWSFFLRPRRPSVFLIQVLLLILAMVWRLDFGERAHGFAGPWYAEECAVFGLIGSWWILAVSRLIACSKKSLIETNQTPTG